MCGGSTCQNYTSNCKELLQCRYKRTKYSEGTDKRRRFKRSDIIAEVVTGELWYKILKIVVINLVF